MKKFILNTYCELRVLFFFFGENIHFLLHCFISIFFLPSKVTFEIYVELWNSLVYVYSEMHLVNEGVRTRSAEK